MKWILSLLIVALIIRIIVMIWALQYRENTDVLRYRDWGKISYLHGLDDTYKPDHLSFGTLPNNQPPGSTYSIAGAYQANIFVAKAYLRIAGNTEPNRQFAGMYLQNAVLRIPQILADLLLGFLIYVFVKKFKPGYALLAAGLYLFNPVVIYNSSFWGQMDSINNIFLFACLFLLINKKYFFAIIAFFCSLFIKFSLIFLLPLFIIALYKVIPNKKTIIPYCLGALGIFAVATLPVSLNPFAWYLEFLNKNSLGEMQHITNFAFNFWWALYKPAITGVGNENLFAFSEIRLSGSPLDSTTVSGIPLAIWGVGLFIATVIPLYYKFYKTKKTSPQLIMLLFAISALLAYLFLPRMHERYMYPLFPLLATYIGLTRQYLWEYCLLAMLNFTNLYISWHPIPVFFFPYDAIYNAWIQWMISIVTVIVSIVLYLKVNKIFTKK